MVALKDKSGIGERNGYVLLRKNCTNFLQYTIVLKARLHALNSHTIESRITRMKNHFFLV